MAKKKKDDFKCGRCKESLYGNKGIYDWGESNPRMRGKDKIICGLCVNELEEERARRLERGDKC